eukprot:444756-Hanusia_phi.AAC.1
MGNNKRCKHGTCAIVGFCLHEKFVTKSPQHDKATGCHSCPSVQQVKANRRRNSDFASSPRQKNDMASEVDLQTSRIDEEREENKRARFKDLIAADHSHGLNHGGTRLGYHDIDWVVAVSEFLSCWDIKHLLPQPRTKISQLAQSKLSCCGNPTSRSFSCNNIPVVHVTASLCRKSYMSPCSPTWVLFSSSYSLVLVTRPPLLHCLVLPSSRSVVPAPPPRTSAIVYCDEVVRRADTCK